MYFIFVSGCLKLKQLYNNPVFKHCQLVIFFLVFSVGLLAADIITDIISAIDFFKHGEPYWGSFTLIPIVAPFAVRSVITFIGFCRFIEYLPKINKKKNKYDEWLYELKQLHWHLPMLQPIRLVNSFIFGNLK
jgi:hypothetical protein